MLKYKKNPTLSQGGIDIGLKVCILAEIGYMLHECAVYHTTQVVMDCCTTLILSLPIDNFYHFLLTLDESESENEGSSCSSCFDFALISMI